MYYINVPSHIYLDKTLKEKAKFLYGLIVATAQKDGVCYATNKYLADALEVTTRSISSYLAQLEASKLIFVKTHNNNWRLITTIDTQNGVLRRFEQNEVKYAKNNKKPFKTQKTKVKKDNPQWVNEYLEELKQWGGE